RGLLSLQGQHRGVVRYRAVRRVSRRAEDPHGGVLDRVPRGGPGRPGAPLAARLPVPAAARRPWARDGRGVAGRGRLSRRARARGAPRVGGRARAADRAHGRATTVSSAPARLRLSAPGHAAVAAHGPAVYLRAYAARCGHAVGGAIDRAAVEAYAEALL